MVHYINLSYLTQMDVESQATRTIVRLSGSTQPIWCYPTWSHLLPNDLKGVPHLLYVVRSPACFYSRITTQFCNQAWGGKYCWEASAPCCPLVLKLIYPSLYEGKEFYWTNVGEESSSKPSFPNLRSTTLLANC